MTGFSSKDDQVASGFTSQTETGFTAQKPTETLPDQPDLSDVQTLKGTPVASGMPTSPAELGSPDPGAGVAAMIEAPVLMASGLPNFIVGTFAKTGNGIINTLNGTDKPWQTAVKQTDEFLKPYTYESRTKQGGAAAKGLTYGMVAITAPYLLPFLGVSEGLSTDMAKKVLTDEQIARLQIANDVLMLGAPGAKAKFDKIKSAYRTAEEFIHEPAFLKLKAEKAKSSSGGVEEHAKADPAHLDELAKSGELGNRSDYKEGDFSGFKGHTAEELEKNDVLRGKYKQSDHFYRGQHEEPTIDKDGNLIISGKRDTLYERNGLLQPGETGVSVTDIPESASGYGEAQAERNGKKEYFLIKFSKDVENKIINEEAESKLVGDVKIPKGKFTIEKRQVDIQKRPAEHVESVAQKADTELPAPREVGPAKPYKKAGFFRRVADSLNIDPMPRTSRVSEPVADEMSQVAGAPGQGNRITQWLVSKVFPNDAEHYPKYLFEKADEKLSARERDLKNQANRRNSFGDLLIKDRIVGIWKTAQERAATAGKTIQELSERLSILQDEYRKQSRGHLAQSASSILPEMEAKIKELTETVEKARADHRYYTEKATNVEAVHPVQEYQQFVARNMISFSKELESWKQHVNPYLDNLLKESKGISEEGQLDTDNTGYLTGARINLVHADVMSPEWENGHVVKNKADMSAKEKPAKDTGKSVTKDPWDREAKGTGSYTTSLYGMLRPVVSKRWQSFTKLRFYDALEKSQLGRLVGPEERVPHEINGRPMVNLGTVEVPVTNAEGKTKTTMKHLFVGEDIAPEVKQLFLDDASTGELPGARLLTDLQLGQIATDAVTHGMNQFSLGNKFFTNEFSRITSKLPLVSPAEASTRFMKTTMKVLKNDPEMIERVKEMGEKGLLRDGYHSSWLAEKVAKLTGRPVLAEAGPFAVGQTLLKMDTAMRITLDDHYSMMVKEGLLKNSETNRRNFILQVGNYNARMMQPWMAQLRKSAISPFIVAGSTFTRNAIRFGTGNPGAETTGFGASMQLRAEHLVKPIIFGTTIPAMWNLYKVGHWQGRPGTPPGHLDMGGEPDENGKFETFNMMVGTPYDRFMRLTGGQAAWEGVNSGKTPYQIAGQAALDSARALKHIAWGPGAEGLFVAATGHDTDFEGRSHLRNRETPAGKLAERARAALEVTSPQAYAAISGENMGTTADESGGPVEKRLTNIGKLVAKAPKTALGVRESHTARTAAEQEMIDRSIHLDQEPDADTKEAKLVLKKGIHLSKTDEAGAIDYLKQKIEKGTITQAQAERAWKDRELPNLIKDFKRFGVQQTATEKGSYAALHIYKMMNEQEKAQVTEILHEKIERAWKKADATKQRELLRVWNSILPEVFRGEEN